MGRTNTCFAVVVVASSALIGCGALGGPKLGTLPPAPHAAPDPAEVVANPCLYGDRPRCEAICRRGKDPGACNAIGILYEYGGTTKVEHAQAARFYAQSCGTDYPPACNNLAWLYALGRGVPKDPPMSLALFTRAYDGFRMACGRGEPSGCIEAATMLLEGRGVDEDEPTALALLDTACARGLQRGCAQAEGLRAMSPAD